MKYEFSESDKVLIRKIKTLGIEEIWIYKSHNYVSLVTFLLGDKSCITVNPVEEHVNGRFSVYVPSFEEKKINSEPVEKLNSIVNKKVTRISSVRLYDWELPTSDEDKVGLYGNPEGATTIYTGRKDEIPEKVLNTQSYDAGIRIDFEHDSSFYVLTGNPFELAVCFQFSCRKVDESIYEITSIC